MESRNISIANWLAPLVSKANERTFTGGSQLLGAVSLARHCDNNRRHHHQQQQQQRLESSEVKLKPRERLIMTASFLLPPFGPSGRPATTKGQANCFQVLKLALLLASHFASASNAAAAVAHLPFEIRDKRGAELVELRSLARSAASIATAHTAAARPAPLETISRMHDISCHSFARHLGASLGMRAIVWREGGSLARQLAS